MNILNRISFKSLYVLSVVAQKSSLASVADTLNITPSAVTHQMKRLEQQLGMPLLTKKGKCVEISAQAKQFAQQLQQHFAAIESTTLQFMKQQNLLLNVGVDSAFAVNRLSATVGIWLEANPDVDLRLKMLNCHDLPNDLDLDIVLSEKPLGPAYHSKPLARHEYLAVCTPHLLSEHVNQSAHAANIPLLDLDGVECWQRWRQQNPNITFSTGKTQYFSHTLLMQQAALASQGIALLEKHLIEPQLSSGQLVKLDVPTMSDTGLFYHYGYKAHLQHNPVVEQLQVLFASMLQS